MRAHRMLSRRVAAGEMPLRLLWRRGSVQSARRHACQGKPERVRSIDLAGLTVLLVEDEPIVAMDLTQILERFGCRVVGPALTVGEAMTLLDGGRPDAVLLDLELGREPATPVAEALAGMAIPFLVTTGYDRNPGDGPALNDAPRITKPFSEGELKDALERLLRAKRPAGDGPGDGRPSADGVAATRPSPPRGRRLTR